MARLLLLAGTQEARLLASRLAGRPGLEIALSYAGLTAVRPLAGSRSRQGGFGGAAGFERYLRDQAIDLVVNATHPFALTMSATARQVCERLALRYLRLRRPPWQPKAGERWHSIDAIGEAARALPAQARVLVTSGRDWPLLAQARADLRLFVRVLSAPPREPPAHVELIVARPPFSVAQERALLRRLGCTHLLTKNAGGAAGRSKIDAAAEFGLEILVIERPAGRPEPAAETVEQALAWLDARLGDGPPGTDLGRR